MNLVIVESCAEYNHSIRFGCKAPVIFSLNLSKISAKRKPDLNRDISRVPIALNSSNVAILVRSS